MAIITNPINTNGVSAVPGADNRSLGLKLYQNEMLTFYNAKNVALNLVRKKTITSGTVAQFMVSGKSNASTTHTPGAQVVSGTIKMDERTVIIKDRKVVAHSLDKLDEKLSQVDIRSELVKQSVETLSNEIDLELFTLIETAVSTAGVSDQSTGSTSTMTGFNALTDAEAKGDAIVEGMFALNSEFNKKNIPSEDRVFVTSSDNYSYIVQSRKAIDKDYSNGNGGIDSGTVMKIAGVSIIFSNNLPTTANLQGLMFHKNAVCIATAMDITTEMNYDFNTLSDLLTSYVAYGTDVLDPGCAGALISS